MFLEKVYFCFFGLLCIAIPQLIACPTQCRCTRGQAVCTRLPVTDIQRIPADTRALTIQSSDLTTISAEMFAHLPAIDRIKLVDNRIVQLPVFDRLTALRVLQVEGSQAHCDCAMFDSLKRLQQKRIRISYICATPTKFRSRNLLDIPHEELFCESLQPLYASDGSTMFMCSVDDDLILDEFETSNGNGDYGEENEEIGIQNFASNIYGEHDCVFEEIKNTDQNKMHVKMVVTSEANEKRDTSVNSMFKAELLVRPTDHVNTDIKLTIQCPDSGKFRCKAEYQLGRPSFVIEPYDIEAYEDTTIELPCSGEGDPEPEVKWKKDGKFIETSAKYRIVDSGSLFIKKIKTGDSGRYECTLKNRRGSAHKSALVKILTSEIDSPSEKIVRIAFADAARDIDNAINQTMDYLFSNKPNRPRHHGDLFKIVRYPRGNARELARASEIYERTLYNIRKRIDGGAKINAKMTDFNYHELLSFEHLELIAQLSGCNAHRIIPNCTDNMCYHLKYRSVDGTCNNLQHPSWGASLTGFRRLLKPIYENGFNTPVGWEKDRLYFSHKKPSARLISNTLISTKEITQDDRITHMVMQWGQFLDHDLDHAIPAVSSESWDGVDCKKTCENAAPCYPIQVPPNDARVTNRRCIDLFRSSSICGSGMTSILFNTVQPREQINQLTSYIDASQVYGFSAQFARDLRNLTTNDGWLRTGVHFPNQKSLLPFASPTDGIDCRRDLEESKVNCFAAGDIRVNEQISLTAMHTIWLREHNRLATELKRINLHWDGETLYQEARKIVGAQMQLITYEHWLPIVLGPEGMNMLGPYKGYDATVEPTISNEFATAAFRFGHTLINPILHRLNETFQVIPQGHLELHRAFFAPWRLVYEGGVDPLMRGMFSVAAKLKRPSENLNTELTEKLFFNFHAVALDLAAINIQRGRDHGLPGYNEYRLKCNLPIARSFEDLRHEISDAGVRKKLKEIYGHPSNIDLFVGGILEDQVPGGKIGPLFRCIMVDQFDRLRRGDRHFYENPSVFRPEQLSQIKLATLGRVLCDNGDNITQITDNTFILPEVQGGYKSCKEIPMMDLSVWLNCEKCSGKIDPNTFITDVNVRQRERRDVGEESETSDDLTGRLESLEQAFEEFKQRWNTKS